MDKEKEYIMSLSDTRKINYIKSTELNDYEKSHIIRTMCSDELKLEALPLIKEEFLRTNIILTLRSNILKLEALSLINDEFLIKDIIMSLFDVYKLRALPFINNENLRNSIIISLSSDELKIKALEDISNEHARYRVIISLSDKKLMLEQMQKLTGKTYGMILDVLQNEDIIKTQLQNMSDKRNIALGLMALKNKYKKRKYFEMLFLDKERRYSEIGLDKAISIGIEIETEGVMSGYITKLHKIVVQRNRKGWNAKDEVSLNYGVEITSPVLTDSKENVEDIYMICAMLKECGQVANARCGGHIHIGANYLTSGEAYKTLMLGIWENTEKILYLMSNEKGNIPREGASYFAFPISHKLNSAIRRGTINIENEEDLKQVVDDFKKIQKNRFAGVNLLNVNNRKNTIEFRVPNGTINPDTWIENARLFGRIVQMSEKISKVEKRLEQSEEDKKLLDLYRQLGEEMPEREKAEILLEMLFSEEEREIYRERYILNSELLEQMPDEQNPLKTINFDKPSKLESTKKGMTTPNDEPDR